METIIEHHRQQQQQQQLSIVDRLLLMVNFQTNNKIIINNLLKLLILFIIINLILILWIIISLNLLQQQRIKLSSSNNDKMIDGNLVNSGNITVYTNKVIHTSNDSLLIQFESPLDNNIDIDDVKNELNPLGNLLLKSNDNSLELSSINDYIEFKINKRFIIENVKPYRLIELQIENDTLSIVDTSELQPSIPQHQQLRLSQINTDSIVGCVDQHLRIESRTEKLLIESNNSTTFESNNGPISMKSYENIVLNSDELILNGRNILLPNLNINNRKSINPDPDDEPVAYQVCMCTNGQLFIADETIPCQADQNVCGSHDQ